MSESPKSPPLPLTALRSFEALARCLDVKAAGAELNVTPSAIMHQIRQLEEVLGRKLIMRDRAAITLTPGGRILFSSTNKALTILRQAMVEVGMEDQANALNILIIKDVNHPFIRERINSFVTANSAVSVNVTTDPLIDTELVDSYSVVFSSSIFNSDLFAFRHIHQEELQPFCRPDYLKAMTRAGGSKVLPRLLIVDGEDDERDALLAAFRERVSGAFNIISFPTRGDAARAAAEGVGVAMIDKNLHEEQIIEGLLVPAGLGDILQVRDCYLAVRKSLAGGRVLRDFAALFIE